MKKLLLSFMILGFLIYSFNIAVFAAQNNERGYISLSTSANAEISPDTAEISFAVKTSDTKSMQKATTANKEISEKIYTLLKTMITTQNGDWIKTADYTAAPVYVYTGNKKNLDKYEVSNRIIIHTKSIDKIGAMIDKAIENGATNVDSLKFSVSNYENQCNSLIEQASKKATTRASFAVKSIGATLDGIRSMDVSCNEQSNYNMPRFYMAKNMISSVADSSENSAPATSISEGTIKIYANVNTSFYVK